MYELFSSTLGTSLDAEHTGTPEALSRTLIFKLGALSLMQTDVLQLQHLHILIVICYLYCTTAKTYSYCCLSPFSCLY